jgi:hypothetical protein
VERAVELKTIRQHNDGLRAALAFVHRKPDRLRPVREQAAAKASGVLDHPMSVMILPDVQAGQSSAARGFDVLLDHEFSSFCGEGPGAFFRRVRRLKSSFGRRSVGREPDQKLRHEGEGQRNHQQHAETGEHLQWLRRVNFAWIVSIETETWGIFISGRCLSVP